MEDFELAHLEHGIAVPDTVSESGQIMAHLPIFGGMHVLRDNQKIADLIASHKGVIGIGKLVHSYPILAVKGASNLSQYRAMVCFDGIPWPA